MKMKLDTEHHIEVATIHSVSKKFIEEVLIVQLAIEREQVKFVWAGDNEEVLKIVVKHESESKCTREVDIVPIENAAGNKLAGVS